MDITIIIEARFNRTPDGAIWTKTEFTNSFWQRYLIAFDNVRVVARLCDVASVPSDWQRSDGDRVAFESVPYYIGPWQYILRSPWVRRSVRKAVKQADAVILRVPSQLSRIAFPFLHKSGRSYGVEVVADSYDVYAAGSIKHILRPMLRILFTVQTKQQCANAVAALYVTEKTLQRRYPCQNYSVGISDVMLPDSSFNLTRQISLDDSNPIKLLLVGSLEQLYKAPDVLIDAVEICLHEGLNLKLSVAGDGKYRAELEKHVESLRLSNHIEFLGKIAAGDAVRAQLDSADLFILPSKTEGLPRALIEAMARGLPCIGSTAGGIPELLPLEDMVTPGDAAALAAKIREFVTDKDRMIRSSKRNLEKAKEYRDEVLHKRRTEFYFYLREMIERDFSNRKNY